MITYTDAAKRLKISDGKFDGVLNTTITKKTYSRFDDASIVGKLSRDNNATKPPEMICAFFKKEIDILKEEVSKLKETPRVATSKMYGLISDEYELKNTIDIVLKILPDEVLALIPDLEIYGEGITETEAINDLKMELIDLYEDLVNIPDKKLGKSPKAWKKIVKTIVSKKCL